MTDQEILAVLTRVLRDVLGDNAVSVSIATVRADVPGWDSSNYVAFIVALEMELGIRFSIADVESFVTVGDIVADARRLRG